MTTLDLHPAPQAAPAAARIRNHARTEIRLVMRNGEQLLLAATPLGRSGLLAGKAMAYSVISLVQVILLVIVSSTLGWHPHGSALAWLPALGNVILAMLAFGFLALAMAGSLKAEVTLGLANLIYIVGLVAGAILWPLTDYPKAIRPIIAVLPTTALGESLRAWGAGQTLWSPLIWAILLGLLARKVFRWIS